MFILLNGQILKADKARLHSFTPGILKARGVFETMRVDRREIFDFKDHLKRMRKGLNFFHLKMPYSARRWIDHIQELLGLNNLKEARVRLMVWRGKNTTQSAVICQAMKKQKKRWKVIIQKVKGLEQRPSGIKSLDYSLFRKNLLKAREKGYDETILVNESGYLAEGTRSNLFFVKDKILYTPSLQCGCLRGITRQHVLQSAKKLGMICKEIKAAPDRLLSADEAFVTNSIVGIMPLVRAGKVKI